MACADRDDAHVRWFSEADDGDNFDPSSNVHVLVLVLVLSWAFILRMKRSI